MIVLDNIEHGNSLMCCENWRAPTVIVSDGPYGLGLYRGEPRSTDGLDEWYEPFLMKWYEKSLPSTTLWFWCSELGWATCHKKIVECGWDFVNCHTWDKGLSHIAGNCNTKTIRKFPVVSEVCVQYVRRNNLSSPDGLKMSLKAWLRNEWQRSGLPLNEANVACGVKGAAARKYLTNDDLWYFPPPEMFSRLADYSNLHGSKTTKPYFSKDDGTPFSTTEWGLQRAKFHCIPGWTNVWRRSGISQSERVLIGGKSAHVNQKPVDLMEMIIKSSSDTDDVVWEPFGGLFSASLAAFKTGRIPCSSEIDFGYYKSGIERLSKVLKF